MNKKLYYLLTALFTVMVLAVMASSASVTNNEKQIEPDSCVQTATAEIDLTEPLSEVTTEINTADDTEAGNASGEILTEAPLTDSAEAVRLPAVTTAKALSAASDSVSLPEEEPLMIALNQDYQGYLIEAAASEAYMFSALQRGTVSFQLRHPSFSGAGGWRVSLCSIYYLNGVDGETRTRTICQLLCTSDSITHNSVKVGVMPGSYCLIVESFGGYVDESYSIRVNFTARSDYEVECNDTITRYTELVQNTPMYGTASYFTDKQDTDWYMLRVYEAGIMRILFTHPVSNLATVSWRVVMYNSDGKELYSENSTFATEKTDSGFLGLQPGVYFISVTSRVYSDAEYSLQAIRVPTGVYESEYNDTKESATAMKTGSYIYGNTASRQGSVDYDYYRLTLTENGIVKLSFMHDEIKLSEKDNDRTGWNIRFITADDTLLYSAKFTYKVSSLEIPAIGLAAGEYYIVVDCDNCYRSNVDYGVKADFTASADYETEPDDTMETALTLTEGETVYGNLTDSTESFDTDYYRFTLSAENKVNFSFSHDKSPDNDSSFRVALRNSDGSIADIYLSDGSSNDGGYITVSGSQLNTAFSAVLSAGDYYLEITTGDYYTDVRYGLKYKEEILQ